MRRRVDGITDAPIHESDRKYHWPLRHRRCEFWHSLGAGVPSP
jgi:nuclear transport factor 2 (NTF2) superfamily protein